MQVIGPNNREAGEVFLQLLKKGSKEGLKGKFENFMSAILNSIRYLWLDVTETN